MKMIFTFIATRAAAQEEEADPDEDDIEEIVVTGTRTGRRLGEEPVAVEVVDREAIEASGAQDVATLLDQHPGVDVARDALGASVRLRGADADQVLILVDGQRIVGRTGGVLDLSRIPVDDIERIEIVKGPASALYGSDAVGGVIQIVTRRAATTEGSLAARGGWPVAADGSASLSAAGRWGGVRVTGGLHGSSAFDLEPRTVATSGDAERQGDLAVRLDPEAGANLEVPVSLSFALTDASGVDEDAGEAADAVFDRRTATEDVVATVRPTLVTGKASKLSTHLGASWFRDQYLLDQRGSDALDTYEVTQEALGQVSVQLDAVVWERMVATVGVDGIGEWISSPRLQDGTGQRLRGAVFVQDEWRVTDRPRLALVPGARLDLDTWFGLHPTPKLAARLDASETLTFRSSVGTGYRAPSFRELLLRFENASAGYVVLGNPDLEPERSLGADAAVEWEPTEVFGASLSGWWTEFSELIDIVEVEALSEYAYVNVERARTRGVEAAVEVRPWRPVEVQGSYTFTDARDLGLDRPLSGRATHRGTVGLSTEVAPTGTVLAASAAIVGPRPFYASDQIGSFAGGADRPVISEAHALADVRVEQRLAEPLSLVVGVDNVLDAGQADYLRVAPRFLYAGVDASVRARGKEKP